MKLQMFEWICPNPLCHRRNEGMVGESSLTCKGCEQYFGDTALEAIKDCCWVTKIFEIGIEDAWQFNIGEDEFPRLVSYQEKQQ